MRRCFQLIPCTLALVCVGCEDKAEDPNDFCGSGTQLDRGECVSVIQCGSGTTQVNGECIPSEGTGNVPCGTGTVSDGIVCVPSDEACAAGTSLLDGQCVADVVVCGAGTEPGEGGCVIAESACGADTTLDGEACVGVVTCGEGAERVGDECVGPLYCDSALDAVEVADAEGVPACVAEVWGPVTADTLALRLATVQCESRFRCCEADPFEIVDTGGGDFGQYSASAELGTCISQMTWIWDLLLALPEARMLLAESPPRATFDTEYAELLVDLFVANDECQILFQGPIVDRILGSEGGFFGDLFQGQRALDEPCSVTDACGEGLVCRDPDPSTSGDTLTCLAPAEESDLCDADQDCADGLFCADGAEANTCEPQLGAGDVCFGDEDCGPDLSCFEGPSDYQCQPIAAPAEGYMCDSTPDCVEDEYCNVDTCAPRAEIDDPCSVSEECPDGTVCVRDDPEDELGVCAGIVDPCSFLFFAR